MADQFGKNSEGMINSGNRIAIDKDAKDIVNRWQQQMLIRWQNSLLVDQIFIGIYFGRCCEPFIQIGFYRIIPGKFFDLQTRMIQQRIEFLRHIG